MTNRQATAVQPVPSPQQRRMLEGYDKSMLGNLGQLYYGGSGFCNWGFWTADTKSQTEASDALVEKLLDFIPDKSGSILDVACGLGATTRHLLDYYPPESVTGINFSEAQLEEARRNAPGCSFRYMDAVNLDFPDNSFDNLICVEAAFHFDTREQFYREAVRVLRPGGRLVTTDIVADWVKRYVPGNSANSPIELQQNQLDAGFTNVSIIEATHEVWHGFVRNVRRTPGVERRAGRLKSFSYLSALLVAYGYTFFTGLGLHNYVLTCAEKPGTAIAP